MVDFVHSKQCLNSLFSQRGEAAEWCGCNQLGAGKGTASELLGGELVHLWEAALQGRKQKGKW